jgi:hypothetical protein
VLALAAASATAAQPPVLLKFKGAIGVDPLTAAGGVDVSNVVRGINPGGRAWVIRALDATVYADGYIVAQGKGLLFSSGDVIATTGPVTRVVATLACGSADPAAEKFTSDSFPLNPAGNFKISGTLTGKDTFGNPLQFPSTCANPKLLIRASGPSGPGGWFAVGILDSDIDD